MKNNNRFVVGSRVRFFHPALGDFRVGEVLKVLDSNPELRTQYKVGSPRRMAWEKAEDLIFYCLENYLEPAHDTEGKNDLR